MQCDAGADPGVVGTVLRTEVDALLLIGAARRELAADGEPSAPCPSGPRHRDRGLGVVIEREELVRRAFEFVLQRRVDAVPGDPEEADLATRPVDLGRHRFVTASVVLAGSSNGAMSTIGRSLERSTWRWAPLLTTGSVRRCYGRVAQLVRALP